MAAVNITYTNQKPVELSPIVNDKINNTFDPVELLKHTAVEPLRNPFNANTKVRIACDGSQLDDDEITEYLLRCCGETVDIQAEDTIKAIYEKGLIHYPTQGSILNAKTIYAIQSGAKENMPEPSAVCIYNPSMDVIPTCRKFLAGQVSYDAFFATLAFYAKPQTLGFYFANEQSFNDFKNYFAQETANLQNILPQNTVQLAGDFQTLHLNGLTESILLRNNDTEENDPFSFARFLINRLMNYTSQVSDAEFGILPFDLGELICPKSVVFVNVDNHSRAKAREVANEWNIINNSIQNKTPMISINKLNKLTASQRNMMKISAMAVSATQSLANGALRSAQVQFSKTPPTSIDLAKLIKKIMDNMAFVNKSMNIFKSVKPTYARPNRRDPDDFNKQGKIVSTKYKPDIHLYIDTSGSISERNYQDAVKACIYMAKKLNVNLYFNSFSHILSQAVRLHTKDKSLNAIYKEFRAVPKVTGGTDFKLVWDYINRSKQRQKEISILMTDFEFLPPNTHIDHPKNLYYIPCSNMNWNWILREAEDFARAMLPQAPDIRKHILF